MKNCDHIAFRRFLTLTPKRRTIVMPPHTKKRSFWEERFGWTSASDDHKYDANEVTKISRHRSISSLQARDDVASFGTRDAVQGPFPIVYS
eukprot:scaffold7485_cov176-Amphora_coffeaeformis.AAC.3